MKTQKILTYSLLALALLAGSCGKNLNISPENEIDADQALETAGDVNNAVIGAYTIIAKGSLYGTNLVMIPDLYASTNYVQWTGSFSTYRQIFNQSLIPTNEDVTRTWVDAYSAINAANTVIGALDVVTDEDQKKLINGKALFIRGIMHFELVRLYGVTFEAGAPNATLGVPIILKAVKNVNQIMSDVKRSTVAEVYNQSEKDLKDAITLLADYPADLHAAHGMLARLYLQQGKFALARDLANTIIKSGDYELLPSLTDPFRVKNSKEGVFEIRQNEQSNAGSANDGLATFYSSYINNTGGKVGRGDLNVQSAFYNSLDNSDKRKTEMIYEGNGAKTGLFSRKWYNFFDNIPIVRLSELYLTRAECNFRLGTEVGADPLDDINEIRERAGLTELATLTLDNILREREIELAFEGYRIHDLKRNKKNIGTLPYNSPKLVFPIPYRETSVNKNLEQNTDYPR